MSKILSSPISFTQSGYSRLCGLCYSKDCDKASICNIQAMASLGITTVAETPPLKRLKLSAKESHSKAQRKSKLFAPYRVCCYADDLYTLVVSLLIYLDNWSCFSYFRAICLVTAWKGNFPGHNMHRIQLTNI